MSGVLDRTIHDSLKVILRPIIRFCLRHSLGIQDLLEIVKIVFIKLAAEELEKAGEKVTVSRLSVMTGLQRPAVKRYTEDPDPKPSATRFTTRVITQWRRDPEFLTANSRPKVLGTEGDESEFKRLVERVSTDLHPRTVLFDLKRLGVVEETKGGVRLKAKAYKPDRDKNPADIYRMLSRDVEDLVEAVMENVEWNLSEELPNFHAYTYFDNVSQEDVPRIRRWLKRACAAHHQRVERYLSQYDLDVNPDPKKAGGYKISMGSFSKT